MSGRLVGVTGLPRAFIAAILIAGTLVLIGWFVRRRRRSTAVPTGTPSAAESADGPTIDGASLEAASNLVALRLWRRAFGAPVQRPPLVRAHARVRDLIHAILEVDELDPSYFPRRPTLMPQLLQEVNDPNAAVDKISRMIAHDPVLTADVLRLANSSAYRVSAEPIETIQRAIAVCGIDVLRGILAIAMLRPVFRASRTNFPRLPRMLWDRTERAARAAELYAAKMQPQDRFEAQLVVLLSALGPLVVYSAALDGYSRAPRLTPNPTLFVDLIDVLAPQMSQRIARDWQTSPRLSAALEKSSSDSLATALRFGELLGTLSLLESQTAISPDERLDILKSAALSGSWVEDIWTGLTVSNQN
jgi:HD-like signal output (HDOD) protein